jgi:serine/threonine protein kinase
MTDAQTPDSLSVGNLVGPWRVEGYAGRGTYGVVYRARRAGHPGSPPVALKLAVFPYDPRFVREVELLSRIHHPSVPQLLDRGWWTSDAGWGHPYLVMEWIRGLPLYEWAQMTQPTARQVLQGVAQIAWALEVLHRADGLHRDVRGGNILVEPEGRAVLMDFGAGTWKGASPLTESLMPPGTREYRSPEALRFQWEHLREKGARYEASPTDDLYALGVTAYRLVTGVYPPPGTDPEARRDPLRAPPPRRLLPQALNGRVGLELAGVIERLMAQEPEARGRALEVAEAAESAAEHVGPRADVPLLDLECPEDGVQGVPVRVVPVSGLERSASESESVPVQVVSVPGAERRADEAPAAVPVRVSEERVASVGALRPGLLAASLIVAVVSTWWVGHLPRSEPPVLAEAEAPDDAAMAPDGGTRGLGDDALTMRVDSQGVPTTSVAISLDMPQQPLDGQRRPPCPRSGEVVIYGGCWKRLADIFQPPCGDDEYAWQGSCYAPVMERTRLPTSHPPQ